MQRFTLYTVSEVPKCVKKGLKRGNVPLFQPFIVMFLFSSLIIGIGLLVAKRQYDMGKVLGMVVLLPLTISLAVTLIIKLHSLLPPKFSHSTLVVECDGVMKIRSSKKKYYGGLVIVQKIKEWAVLQLMSENGRETEFFVVPWSNVQPLLKCKGVEVIEK
jgi:hypothetical protein